MAFCARTQAHLLENQHENTPNFHWDALKSLNSGQECSKMVWPHPLTKKPLDPNVWNSAGNSLKCRFIEDQDPNPAGSCIPALQLNTHTPSAFVCVTYKQCRDISDSWITLTGLLEFNEHVSPPRPGGLIRVFQVLFRCSLELQLPGCWLLRPHYGGRWDYPSTRELSPTVSWNWCCDSTTRTTGTWMTEKLHRGLQSPFGGLSSLFCSVCISLTRSEWINRVNDQQIINE